MATVQVASKTPTAPDRASFQGTEGVYMLPHHAKEIDRLRRQHVFMLSSTGSHLWRTPLSKMRNVDVLDCGCADGTWLGDLATNEQSSHFSRFGIDIGSTLFPAREEQRAKGIDLRQHDLTKPFPSEWQWENKFDVIHQRLLVWGLKSNQWSSMLSNCTKILKPGGWIQLVEAEWINANIPTDLPEQAKLAKMQRWSTSSFGMDADVAYKLEGFLSDAGFMNVQKIQYDHGYGHLARVKEQGDSSAELYVEFFRTLDAKMGFGTLRPASTHLQEAELPELDGIPGVARNPTEFHEFLDRLEVEIKTKGYQPKLNFVIG